MQDYLVENKWFMRLPHPKNGVSRNWQNSDKYKIKSKLVHTWIGKIFRSRLTELFKLCSLYVKAIFQNFSSFIIKVRIGVFLTQNSELLNKKISLLFRKTMIFSKTFLRFFEWMIPNLCQNCPVHYIFLFFGQCFNFYCS